MQSGLPYVLTLICKITIAISLIVYVCIVILKCIIQDIATYNVEWLSISLALFAVLLMLLTFEVTANTTTCSEKRITLQNEFINKLR